MKIWKKLIWGTVLTLFINGVVEAATENGITRTDSAFDRFRVSEYVFFNDYDPGTSTMVYNGAGESAATSGSVSTRRHTVSKLFQIQPSTIGSTKVNVVFYGQSGNETDWVEIVRYGTGTANTVGEYISISENWDRIRVGIQATGTDSVDQVTVTSTMMGER